MAYYSSSHFYLVLAGVGVVGLLWLLARLQGQRRSSWPTWAILPLGIYVALVLGSESKPPDLLHPFYLVAALAVLARWAAALLLRERDLAWIPYLAILACVAAIAVSGGLVPGMHTR